MEVQQLMYVKKKNSDFVKTIFAKKNPTSLKHRAQKIRVNVTTLYYINEIPNTNRDLNPRVIIMRI